MGIKMGTHPPNSHSAAREGEGFALCGQSLPLPYFFPCGGWPVAYGLPFTFLLQISNLVLTTPNSVSARIVAL